MAIVINGRLDVLFFSIAGFGAHKVVDGLLGVVGGVSNLGKRDKEALSYTVETALSGGAYPAWGYYSALGYEANDRKLSASELKNFVSKTVLWYVKQGFVSEVMGVFNTANTLEAYTKTVGGLVEKYKVNTAETMSLPDFECTYTEMMDKPHGKGIMTGIEDIDRLTDGLQGGNIASICAFTGHGKSQTWLSILYKNAMLGRKCVYVSLELPVDMVWNMLETRYMYERKGLQINSQDLMFRKLSGDTLKKVQSYEADFQREVKSNIYVCDTSVLSTELVTSSDRWQVLFDAFDRKLGGLDLVVFDHVNQFELMYRERGAGLGNVIILQIRRAMLEYKNSLGQSVVIGFAVQTNREGFKRARKNKGLYDTVAISDLNEVERASSYCIFIYTDADAGIKQETQVCMPKHRLGAPLNEVVSVQFLPGVSLVGNSVDTVTMDDEFSKLAGQTFDSGAGFGGANIWGDSVDIY